MNPGIHHPDLKLDEPASTLDLEQIHYIIREKAWLIAMCALVGIFAGLAYIHRTPLTYYALTLLEVDPQSTKTAGYAAGADVTTDPIGEEMGQTLLAMFKSRSFAEEVVKSYDLTNNPNFLPPLPNGKPHPLQDAVSALIGMSRVTIRPMTRLIEVGVMHSNPEMARELADMVANTYLNQARDQQRAASNGNIKYLTEEADKAGSKLSDDKKKVQEYVSDHSGTLIAGQDTALAQLKEKMGELNAAHSERIRLEVDDDEIQKHLNDQQALLAIPSVTNHPTILATKNEIQKLEANITVLKLRYTEKHPKVILARKELENQNNLLMENLSKIPARQAAPELTL